MVTEVPQNLSHLYRQNLQHSIICSTHWRSKLVAFLEKLIYYSRYTLTERGLHAFCHRATPKPPCNVRNLFQLENFENQVLSLLAIKARHHSEFSNIKGRHAYTTTQRNGRRSRRLCSRLTTESCKLNSVFFPYLYQYAYYSLHSNPCTIHVLLLSKSMINNCDIWSTFLV